jgi:hypothetical protein
LAPHLRQYGDDPKVIVGGQSLMPLINLGFAAQFWRAISLFGKGAYAT